MKKRIAAWILVWVMIISGMPPTFVNAAAVETKNTEAFPQDQTEEVQKTESERVAEIPETEIPTETEESGQLEEEQTEENVPDEIMTEEDQKDLSRQMRNLEPGLIADFSFDNEEEPLDGGLAKATGEYVLSAHKDGYALYLDGTANQWLNVVNKDEGSLLTGFEEITLSFDTKQDRTGTNWPFYISDSAAAPVWAKERYLGGLISDGQFIVERYNNTNGRPVSAKTEIGNDWVHIDVVVTESDTSIYMNGEKKATEASAYSLSQIAGSNGIFQIGKANWGGGEFFRGWIDNFRVYNYVLTEEELDGQYQLYVLENAVSELTLGDTSAIKSNLSLPLTMDGGVAVSWLSSDETVITGNGEVSRPADRNAEVILTATLTLSDHSVQKEFTVTVVKGDSNQDLEDAKKALKMLTVTAEDIKLPETGILGTSLTWESSDDTIMTDEGKINKRPASGAGNDKVTMKATISKGGLFVTKDFEIEIMEEFYGYILGYITGDKDRTGSLHIAYSKNGKDFTALNGNSGIQFARIDTNDGTKNLTTGIRYTEVYLFRKGDGTFGLAAPQGKNQKSVYLYDSKDLLSYENERLLAANTSSGNISDVECYYDTLVGAYRLNWKNGNDTYSNVSDELTELKKAVEYEYTSKKSAVEKIPDGAKNYNVIPVTKSEYEKIIGRFAVVENTGVSAPAAITVQTAADLEAALPKTVEASYSDGSKSALVVDWGIDSVDYSKAGSYTIPGTVSTYSNPLAEQRADPHIMYDEENQCYYFTGSYPAYYDVNSGYDRIVLRKANSIQKLSDDEGGKDKEITIWTAPSSGQRAKHVWAPELHKIGGKWYVFFAAGNSDNIWAIRPYVLVCQGEDPYDAANWTDESGNAEIHAATSQESAYFKNMSLDMTYFTDGTAHYVIWADIIGQSALYMQKIDPVVPWAGISEVIQLTTPEYGWERDTERVNEGATILMHDDKIFCAFSASGTGSEYCIGILYADINSDLMDPDSWIKMSYPLLTSSDVPGEYGPGHNSFTVDDYGNPVFVYHARSQECYDNRCAWASANSLYDPCRHARVKNVHWNEEGLPILKMSADEECPVSIQSTSIQVTVEEDVTKDIADAKVTLSKEMEVTGAQLKPEIKVTYKGTELIEKTDYTVKYGENKVVGKGTVTITAVEGSDYSGSKTVEFTIVNAVNQIVHYDMSRQKDALINDASDRLNGILVDVNDKDFNEYNGVSTLSLNKTGYIELPSGIIDDQTLTVSVTAATTTANNQWLWTFGKNSWNYIFLTPSNGSKKTKLSLAQQEPYNSSGAWAMENNILSDTAALDGKYQTYTAVINNDKTELYVNGKQAGTGNNPFDIMSMIPESGTIGYLGKSLYGGDPLFIGQIADFAVYDEALTESQIKKIVDSVNYEGYITADIYTAMLNGNESPDAVTGSLKFPAKVDGVSLNWSVPESQSVIDKNGKVTLPTDGQDQEVTVSVSFEWNGESITEDFKLKVKSASAEYIEKLADQLTLSYSTVAGKEVYGNITLPESVGEAKIEWTASHPDIVDTKEYANTGLYADDPIPAGQVTRPDQDTDVTMTAKITYGTLQVERKFTLTVKAAPKQLSESDYTDYFFAYFTGEYFADGEQVYFSASRDGLNWSDLNDNQPYLTSTQGEKGVRDPFILRSPEGDKFYLIATDLKINGGNGWTAAQEAGSQSLMVWESTDLVNWSEQRMVAVSAQIDAGCTWAPEATYDEMTGEYVVYWASKIAANGYNKQCLYYAKTRDFYTFTEPEIFIEKEQSTIDTTILKEGNYYYRYSKNENKSNIISEKTETLLHSEPVSIDAPVLGSQGGVEGPSIFKFNEDDVAANGYQYCLLLDNYGGGGYYPMVSNDLEGDFVRYTGSYQLPGADRTPRHGTPIRITAAEYQTVMAAMADKASVTEIKIDGVKLDEYNKQQNHYIIPITGTALPEVSASADGTVKIEQATAENPTATITVTQDNLSEGKVTIEFVRESTDLKLEISSSELEKGNSAKLQVSAVTDIGSQVLDNVEYLSSDPLVLAVSNGKAEAKKAGEATLTAKVKDHGYVSHDVIEKYNSPSALYTGKASDFAGTVQQTDGSTKVPNGHLSFYDIGGTASEWMNYSVSGSFKITQAAAGLVFGAEDKNNFYMWQFKDGELILHKWIGGTVKVLEKVNISLKSDYNDFVIYKERNVIYTYLNKALVSTYVDKAPYQTGTVGLRTGSSEAFDIQGFKVEQTNLVLAQKMKVTDKAGETIEANQKAADKVKGLIETIGTVNYSNTSKAKIDAARSAYNALNAEQRKLVTNYAKLTAAESRYEVLKKQNQKAEVGKIYTVGNYKYKVTSVKTPKVTVTGVKKKTLNSITVKDTVKIKGTTFKVTKIGASAFKNCKKATKATIGKNVKVIGEKAFYNCSKLTKVTIKSTALTEIKSKVFYKCGKLRTIIIKSTKLKTVGIQAFKGIYKNAKIKVPKRKVVSYKRIMKNKGQKATVKITK